MTERLYRDSANICKFLVMTRTMTLITLIMMIMTRTFILLLITIVHLIIIIDIAVLVRAVVSSHHNTSHTEYIPIPYDILNSTNYTSTDIILTFTPILVFLSSFRHKVLFLYLVHILLLSFCYFNA